MHAGNTSFQRSIILLDFSFFNIELAAYI